MSSSSDQDLFKFYVKGYDSVLQVDKFNFGDADTSTGNATTSWTIEVLDSENNVLYSTQKFQELPFEFSVEQPGTYYLQVSSGAPDVPYKNLHIQAVKGEVVNNYLPKAEPGEDMVVDEEKTIILDGSGSYDPDGTIISYKWTQLFTESNWTAAVGIQNASMPVTTFQAPGVDPDGMTLSFALTVRDNDGYTHTGTVNVEVEDTYDGSSSSGGCLMSPHSKFGLEWMLLLVPGLWLAIRKKIRP